CCRPWVARTGSATVTVVFRRARRPRALHGVVRGRAVPPDPSVRSLTWVTCHPLLASRPPTGRPYRLLRRILRLRAPNTGGRGGPGHAPADTFENMLADQVPGRKLDRILTVEAGPAQPCPRLLGRGDQAVQGHEAEGVRADGAADAVDVHAAGDELGPGREVDAVEARPADRRRGDAHVYLHRARLAQHPDDRPLGIAAHDRVVHDHQPLAAHVVAQRVELEPDAQLAERLRGLDEGPADVRVLDQAGAVRDPGLLRVPDGGRDPGLRYADDHVGLRRVLPGECPADRHPGGVHVAPGQGAVRPGEVDVLEQAALRLGGCEPGRPQAVL